jgi:protein-tyrosine phosphatase
LPEHEFVSADLLSVIATSGPSSKYPKRAYRNPTDALVRFLDTKHGDDWAIWEFRAEGTGYPDSEVYGRIHHFPWPDHHPPPFALIPAIMATMRNWLEKPPSDEQQQQQQQQQQSESESENQIGNKRVAVVHCKAGKGRSGTIACSYLISQEGWKVEDALQRFTERRMRVGFGDGVSIASQRRWVGYVNQWANNMRKIYVERPVEILEVHVWGLRDGVKIAIEGYVDEGKKIKCFHLFKRRERVVVDDGSNHSPARENTDVKEEWETKDSDREEVTYSPSPSLPPSTNSSSTPHGTPTSTSFVSSSTSNNIGGNNARIAAAILRPDKPVILPSSDVNIDFERRIKAAYTGWAMVTSIAHVWFNAYFEGGDEHDSGVFECDWENLDGIKGSASKGTKALERVKVVWRYPSKEQLEEAQKQTPQKVSAVTITPEKKVMALPGPGEPVTESHAADWHGANVVQEDDSDMDFAGHRSVANPTNSPVRPKKGSHKIDTSSSNTTSQPTGGKKEVLTGTNHPFVAEASATTAAAVSNAVKRVRKDLGLRKQTDDSRDVSLASSVEDLSLKQQEEEQNQQTEEPEEQPGQYDGEHESDIDGVQPYYKNGSSTGKDEAK